MRSPIFQSLTVTFGLLAMVSSPGSVSGQTAATSPVGFNSVSCPAGSDTYCSIPFTQKPEFAGAPSSVSGSTVTYSGAPFTASGFKYVAGSQSKFYYLYVLGGSKEGSFYTITDNTTNSLTLDLAGDNIGAAGAVTASQIIPYWTLNTALPAGAGTNPNPSIGNPPSLVILPDQTTPGTDLASSNSYFYYTGSGFGGPGWRKLGAITTIVNNVILYPDTYFIVRNNPGASATTFTPVGYVPTIASPVTVGSAQTIAVNVPTAIGTLAANTPQDNALALPVATNVTLADSKLYESGAFQGSSTPTPQDLLLVFDNSSAVINKAATKNYFYYTGSGFGGPGWRLLGSITVNRNNDTPFQPGTGFVIRKVAVANPTFVTWNFRPIYAP